VDLPPNYVLTDPTRPDPASPGAGGQDQASRRLCNRRVGPV